MPRTRLFGSPRGRTTLRAGITTLLLAGVAAGCGSHNGHRASATSSPAGAHASRGAITLSNGRIPQPASPDVAAAYFTLTNASGQSDSLVGASSPAAGRVLVMKEVSHGTVMDMVGVRALVVPGHGKLVLAPGRLHVMLEQLHANLAQGDHVLLTLRFARAGQMKVRVPVTKMGDAGSGSMPSMPGM